MSQKRRHCNKFNSAAGCPYGNDCKFLHDEMSNERESVVISLGLDGNSRGTGSGGNSRGSGSSGGVFARAVTTGYTVPINLSNINLSNNNHKTKLCQKFESMGFCPYGTKCRFAHGSNELVPHGGGLVVPVPHVGRVVPTAPINNRPVGAPSMPPTQNPTVGYAPIVPQFGGYPIGIPPENSMVPRERFPPPFPKLKPRHLMKDRNLVRETYADWIDEME